MTGMSGTGKSSALAELGRRGYRVVDTGDPGWREYREYVESSDVLHRGEWLWVEERITGLLDSDDGRSLFVEGCVRNQSKFYDRFNAVVLLSAPADVILDRVARRTTNNYGKTPLERAMILGPTLVAGALGAVVVVASLGFVLNDGLENRWVSESNQWANQQVPEFEFGLGLDLILDGLERLLTMTDASGFDR